MKNTNKTTYVIQQGVGANSNNPKLQAEQDLTLEELRVLAKEAAKVFQGAISVYVRSADNLQEQF